MMNCDDDEEYASQGQGGNETRMTTPTRPSTSSSASPGTAFSSNQLENCGRWLQSIPRDDVSLLRHSPEYEQFIRAFEALGMAHQTMVSANRNWMEPSGPYSPSLYAGGLSNDFVSNPTLAIQQSTSQNMTSRMSFSSFLSTNNFLQHFVADDVIIRIFEFLECRSLSRAAAACSRFQKLAHLSALQRTYKFSNERQLTSVMQLLRAKEQIDGVDVGVNKRHVRVPVLLLERRIRVSNAGDPEYNGIYFCTGCNGNGFVFTKPRFSHRRRLIRATDRRSQTAEANTAGGDGNRGDANGGGENPRPATRLRIRFRRIPPNAGIMRFARLAVDIGHDNDNVNEEQGEEDEPAARLESEDGIPGQPLRCIIAKRFSSTTILWYLSKEVETQAGDETGAESVAQEFHFFAKLMTVDDANADICRYPSVSAILARNNDGWNSLASVQALHPPTVELLD